MQYLNYTPYKLCNISLFVSFRPGKKVAVIHVVLGFEDKGIITSNLSAPQKPKQVLLTLSYNQYSYC